MANSGSNVETIAAGRAIRDLRRLHREYGAEVHWYEATGIGRKEFKIKRPLEGR
jgi:hypothetical protein